MSASTFFQHLETAAHNAEIGIEDALIFLAHFAKLTTPVATTVETLTGNAELVPITQAVSAGVQSVGATDRFAETAPVPKS